MTDKTHQFATTARRVGSLIEHHAETMRTGATIYDQGHALFTIMGMLMGVGGMLEVTGDDWDELLKLQLASNTEEFETKLNSILGVV